MISITGAIRGNKQSAATLPFDHELLSEIARWITSHLELFIKLVPTYPNNEKNIRRRIKEENCRLGSEVSKKKKSANTDENQGNTIFSVASFQAQC